MIPAVDTLAPSRWSTTAVMTALALTAVLSGTLHAQQLPAELEAELQGQTVFSDGTLLRHASVDAAQAVEIASLLGIGRQRIETFFGEPFPEPFTVTLAPDRDSFSAVLRAEWGVPETACWMVATGVADFMVILSPRVWEEQACEHDPSDKQHVQDIVTHELAHVFHGQRNPTRDFSGAEEIGWYAEGLAVLVADQLNRDRLSDPAQAVASGAAPTRLADAWSGEYRYGVSGSIAAYIDHQYGRQTTLQLLSVTTQAELLSVLDIAEEALLTAWKSWLSESAGG